MNEIKCPKCGKMFTVEESDYAEILSQVRNAEFNNEIERRLHDAAKISESEKAQALTEQEKKFGVNIAEKEQKIAELKAKLEADEKNQKIEKELAVTKAKEEMADEINELKKTISSLESDAKTKEAEHKLAIQTAVQEKEKEINEKEKTISELNVQINSNKQREDLEIKKLKDAHEYEIKRIQEELEKEKNFKLQQNNKMVGENLEQYCFKEFEKVRSMAFPNATFAKDNISIKDEDEIKGTKGDFIFREEMEGVEYISIMFEMKNEMDETKKGTKNTDHLDKLDKDRKKKDCEYAVLVSTLEPDNELYNNGIYDASHIHEKMFIIRPQLFIPMISLLRNAALNSFGYLKKLAEVEGKDADYKNFEKSLIDFRDDFSKSYGYAETNFEQFSKGIDEAIKKLLDIKEKLRLTQKHLGTANNKLEKLSLEKLTKDAPSVKKMFDMIKENTIEIEEK